MSLPVPIPDNPKRWEGWRTYTSSNLYERLCLSYDGNPSNEQIEEHCRQLMVWWQKKLPLKNQPSNPLAQLLRHGIDEAPHLLAEARTRLLDPVERARIDQELAALARSAAIEEFQKFLLFTLASGELTEDDEQNLYSVGSGSGLSVEEMRPVVDAALEKRGARRVTKSEIAERLAPTAPGGAGTGADRSPAEDFRRMLSLSGLSEEDMTDDQRDALCNMGENLGLTGGQAEDLIDEYLEAVGEAPLTPPSLRPQGTLPVPAVKTPMKLPAAAKAPTPKGGEPAVAAKEPLLNISPLARVREREKYANYPNSAGQAMFLIPSGVFYMGSASQDVHPNEQPVTRTALHCFYMSRFPVTNAQYEIFDPTHANRRSAWAGDDHPVVYVTSEDAVRFCRWLSARERKTYRLPTEAEWEYAARGMDGRTFPWGEKLTRGNFANFADASTTFAWRDPVINDGYPETSPVGSYPLGTSPFGVEDMAGNVWEWCLDFFANYSGKERVNPRGPSNGQRRIYRGGSWKSRIANLRATARGFNQPDFSANDLGFRVVCEIS